MKSKKISLLVALTTVGFGVGCGPNYQGSYVGTASVAMPGVNAPASSATVSISQSSGDVMTVSFSGLGTGSAAGRINDGSSASLTSGSLQINTSSLYGANVGVIAPQMYPSAGYPTAYPQGAGYAPSATSTCTITSGNVTRPSGGNSISITGTFAATAVGAYPQTTPGYPTAGYPTAGYPATTGVGVCTATSFTFTGTKQN